MKADSLKKTSEKFRPVILAHILVLIGVDRACVKLLKAVVVAVDQRGVDRDVVVGFFYHLLGACRLETLDQRRHDFLHIDLLLGVIRHVLKQDGGDLLFGAGASAAVYQIGEYLLALAALKMERLAVGRKDVEIAEALHL